VCQRSVSLETTDKLADCVKQFVEVLPGRFLIEEQFCNLDKRRLKLGRETDAVAHFYDRVDDGKTLNEDDLILLSFLVFLVGFSRVGQLSSCVIVEMQALFESVHNTLQYLIKVHVHNLVALLYDFKHKVIIIL
jgi:hypothetical protein